MITQSDILSTPRGLGCTIGNSANPIPEMVQTQMAVKIIAYILLTPFWHNFYDINRIITQNGSYQFSNVFFKIIVTYSVQSNKLALLTPTKLKFYYLHLFFHVVISAFTNDSKLKYLCFPTKNTVANLNCQFILGTPSASVCCETVSVLENI